jgi:hypothetical protein
MTGEKSNKSIIGKAISLTKALLAGKDVSPERVEKRIEVCGSCDKVKIDNFGNMNCGICGCKVSGSRSLINLARYEETADYGCKHPQGSRWKDQGV